MANPLINQLATIRDKVNNLYIDDEKAKEFEGLISQSIEIIQKINNPNDDFFESRRRTALNDLEHDLGRYTDRYWQSTAKTDKISEFSRARNNVNTAINGILSSFKNYK
jgi:hypothetical protein